MPIDQLKDDIAGGRCSEAFACGTAAIVCPIAAIGESDGEVLDLPNVNQMSEQLKDALLDIQEGRAEDPFDWTIPADDPLQLASYLQREG